MKEPLQVLTQGAYALAYQMLGKREDAMDILQDAATVALSHQSAPARHSNEFKPWFYTVVRNRALDLLRKQQRFTHEPLDDDLLSNESSLDPQVKLEQFQQNEAIQKALMGISFEQREIVLLKDYHNFDYQQIAQILDIPKGSVMSRLHRARIALRELLVTKNDVGDIV